MKDIGGQGLKNYIYKYAYLCGTNRRFDPIYDIDECKDDIIWYVFDAYQKLLNLESEVLEDETRLYNYLKRVVWTRASKIQKKAARKAGYLHFSIRPTENHTQDYFSDPISISEPRDCTTRFSSLIAELPQLNYSKLESEIVKFLSNNPSEPRLYTESGKIDIAYLAMRLNKPYTTIHRTYTGLVERWQQKIQL